MDSHHFSLYGFPVPTPCMPLILVSWAVTNYHSLGGLKQRKFIALQFWRPVSKIISLSYSQDLDRTMFSVAALGRISSLLFQLLVAANISWCVATSLQPLKPKSSNLSWLHGHIAFSSLSVKYPSAFLIRLHIIAFRIHLGNQSKLKPLKIVNNIFKNTFPI